MLLQPRRHRLRFLVRLSDAERFVKRCDEAGLNADIGKGGRLRMYLSKEDLDRHRPVIDEIATQAVRDFES